MRRGYLLIAAIGLLIVCGDRATAQQAAVGHSFNSAGNSFYEGFGVGFGLSGPGWFFNSGGGAGNGAPPQFGGFDPNAQATFGVGLHGHGINGFLNFSAGQGSNSTFSEVSPSVMVMNGGFGFINDFSTRPFVTGVVPVVGDFGTSPVQAKLAQLRAEGKSLAEEAAAAVAESQRADVRPAGDSPPISAGGGTSGKSSAERGDLSVAELRRRHATDGSQQQAQIDEWLRKAQIQESAGQFGVAKQYYLRASRCATGEQQKTILAKVRQLDGANKKYK